MINWTFASVFKPVACCLWLSLDLFLDLITRVVVFICMKVKSSLLSFLQGSWILLCHLVDFGSTTWLGSAALRHLFLVCCHLSSFINSVACTVMYLKLPGMPRLSMDLFHPCLESS